MDALTPASALASPAGDEAILARLRALMPAITARAAVLDTMESAVPEADAAALAEAGLLTAPLPRALGGRGWGSEPAGAEPLFEALRLVGRASLPLGRLYEGHVNAIRLVAEHGTPGQRAAAASAQSLDEGQSVALATAQGRFSASAGVNIDEEMSRLIELQTAYSANARVLTAARDMLDTLLRI